MTRSDQAAMRSDPRPSPGKVGTPRARPGAAPIPADQPNGDQDGLSFRSFADCTSIMIWQSGLDRRCTHFNAAWLAYTGRTLDQELEGGWIRGVHADDLDRCAAIYKNAFDARRPFSMEYRLRRGSGDYDWVFVTGAPHIDPDGRFAGYIGTAVDVTDRFQDSTKRKQAEEALRQSEARFRGIFEHAGAGIALVAADGSFRRTNPALQRMLGYSAEELVGMSIVDITHPDDLRLTLDRFAQMVAGECDTYQIVKRYIRKDGRAIWGRLTVSGLPALPPEEAVCIGMVEDITDLRAAEDQARAQQAELARVSRHAVAGEMAAILAHELNQPLAAIANYTQAALQRLRSNPGGHADLLDICSRVDAQARRGAEITRRIASFVRKREPQLSAVDANDLIREILDLAGLIQAGPPGRLRLELAERLPPVLADRIQIQQVVLNLVRNALEASTAGPHTDNPGGIDGPPVIVRSRRGDRPGLVQVDVRDFGPGLTSESVPHIFEPFFTTKPDGMGLGLAISKSIIDAHKGALSASSNADAGATFSFTLRVPSGPRVSRGARHRAR